MSLNGIPAAWRDHPRTTEGWDYSDGINDDLDEPPFDLPAGMKAASGVVIEEADGRVWLIAPTNQFGGYNASLPKGTAEDELSLQGNALKEAFEETGLKSRSPDSLAIMSAPPARRVFTQLNGLVDHRRRRAGRHRRHI